VTGVFRSNATGITGATLDTYHYATNYASLPTLSSSFVQQSAVEVDRTLAVKSTISNQVILDNLFHITAVRVLPTYSTPGLKRL
jgi:hypothetical protein